MKSSLLPSIILSLSFVAFGYLTSQGIQHFSSGNRIVTVKGVSEKDIEADLVYWTIRHQGKAETLDEARKKIRESNSKVLAFLKKFGVKEEEVSVRRVDLNELTQPDELGRYTKVAYSIVESLMVRSNSPKVIELAYQSVLELIDSGVFLEGAYGPEIEPIYSFTRLNDFKPEMIAEATKNAKESADQFAGDSDSKVGVIRRANQGLFEILGRDKAVGLSEYSQREKTLRVVVTLEYYLE